MEETNAFIKVKRRNARRERRTKGKNSPTRRRGIRVIEAIEGTTVRSNREVEKRVGSQKRDDKRPPEIILRAGIKTRSTKKKTGRDGPREGTDETRIQTRKIPRSVSNKP